MGDQKIEQLIDILGNENKIYKELLKLSKEKTDVIVKGHITELENITKLEQSLILNMGKLEQVREDIVTDLSHKFNLNSDTITMSELFTHLNEQDVEKLKNHKTKLLDTINQIKEVNDTNSRLIQNSIEYINFSVNLLSSVPSDDNNYECTGQTKEGSKRNYFDVKL